MIEINNLANFSVDKIFFKGVAKKVLKGENKEKEDLSIAFVSSEEMQKINKQFRKKDKPTDVLSFEKESQFKNDFSEVIICPEVVKEKIKDFDINLKKELTRVLIHGILHCLGYDHEISKKEEVRMFQKENYYFKILNQKS